MPADHLQMEHLQALANARAGLSQQSTLQNAGARHPISAFLTRQEYNHSEEKFARVSKDFRR